MNTLEYIDAVKQRRGIASDYALAKELGIAKQTMSSYRKGKTHFDDAVCRRVAELLGIHPGLVMLDMQRERSQSPESHKVWQEVFEGFLTLLLPANGKGFRPTL